MTHLRSLSPPDGTAPEIPRSVPDILAELRGLLEVNRSLAARIRKTRRALAAEPLHEDALLFVEEHARDHAEWFRVLARHGDRIARMAAENATLAELRATPGQGLGADMAATRKPVAPPRADLRVAWDAEREP